MTIENFHKKECSYIREYIRKAYSVDDAQSNASQSSDHRIKKKIARAWKCATFASKNLHMLLNFPSVSSIRMLGFSFSNSDGALFRSVSAHSPAPVPHSPSVSHITSGRFFVVSFSVWKCGRRSVADTRFAFKCDKRVMLPPITSLSFSANFSNMLAYSFFSLSACFLMENLQTVIWLAAAYGM